MSATQDEYARLFNQRGSQYHAAMARYPRARDAEFRTVLDIAALAPGDVVADIPCGGGYLAGYLPEDITLWSVDSSDVFADCYRQGHRDNLLLCPLTAIPLPDGSLDVVLSIAGLHHVADRRAFWAECARLLRPGGTLVVADVRAGSAVAGFLDSIVDRHTATGHKGIYFDDSTVGEMTAAGFSVALAEPRRTPWRATDKLAMADFCRLLFGLEGIDNATIATLLASEIGIAESDNGVALAWELMCFRATRR